MSAGDPKETPTAWTWPCTLGDLSTIEALPPEVRTSVERYIRSRLDTARANGVTVLTDDDPTSDEYFRGWSDGAEAMQDAVSSVFVPAPRRRRPPPQAPKVV